MLFNSLDVIPDALTLSVSAFTSNVELSGFISKVIDPELPPPVKPSPATILVISPDMSTQFAPSKTNTLFVPEL